LGDVFRSDKARLERVVEFEAGESGYGGAAIRSAVGIGNGKALEFRAAQQIERRRRQMGVFAGPQHEGAPGIGDGGRRIGRTCGVGEASINEVLGVTEVRGEKQVKGGAVLDLCRECSGGLVGDVNADAGCLPELVEDRGQNGLQVGGRGYAQRRLGNRGGKTKYRQ
jgi:hypothetical protein